MKDELQQYKETVTNQQEKIQEHDEEFEEYVEMIQQKDKEIDNLHRELKDPKWVELHEVVALKKDHKKELEQHKDELDKLRKIIRDSDVGISAKKKHGRETKCTNKPKKTKQPKVGSYKVTSSKP